MHRTWLKSDACQPTITTKSYILQRLLHKTAQTTQYLQECKLPRKKCEKIQLPPRGSNSQPWDHDMIVKVSRASQLCQAGWAGEAWRKITEHIPRCCLAKAANRHLTQSQSTQALTFPSHRDHDRSMDARLPPKRLHWYRNWNSKIWAGDRLCHMEGSRMQVENERWKNTMMYGRSMSTYTDRSESLLDIPSLHTTIHRFL
jgi:hypothetical protein